MTENFKLVNETSGDSINNVVGFLREMGYMTLPSYEGCELSLEDFENAYDHLSEDVEVIRTDGLTLLNLESGQKKILKDPTYKLPWDSAEAMFISSLGNDLTGFLGVICPTIVDSKPLWELAKLSDNITVSLLGHHSSSPIIGVSVKSDDLTEHHAAWNVLTEMLKENILP